MDRAIFEFIILIMKFSAGECLGFIITGLDYFSISEDLSTTRTILYCVVITVCRVAGVKFAEYSTTTRPENTVTAWQYRIKGRIAEARTLMVR